MSACLSKTPFLLSITPALEDRGKWRMLLQKPLKARLKFAF